MPTVIQSVVCAIDLSSFSPLVVAHGAVLARRAGVPLHLFHAIHDPQDRVHATTLFEHGGDLAEARERARQRIQQLMDAADVSATPHIAFGDPVEKACAFLDGKPPCLLISASHGVSGFRRFFVGTVVERMTRTLGCPMLVVKPVGERLDTSPPGYRRLVVGCDAGGHWRQLGALMPFLGNGSGLRLNLVHVLERPLDFMGQAPAVEDYNAVQETLRQRLCDALERQAWEDLPNASRVQVSVLPGDPAETLLGTAAAEDADLIVVGVRRSGMVARWLAGSTTEDVLRRSSCSVLTLPEALPEHGAGSDAP